MAFSIWLRYLGGGSACLSLPDGSCSLGSLRIEVRHLLGFDHSLPLRALQLFHSGRELSQDDISLWAAGLKSGAQLVLLLNRNRCNLQVNAEQKARWTSSLFGQHLLGRQDEDEEEEHNAEEYDVASSDSENQEKLPSKLDGKSIAELLQSEGFAHIFLKSPNSKASPHISDSTPSLIDSIMKMGFSKNAAQKALLLNQFDIDVAIHWLLEHSNESDIHEPLTQLQVERLTANISVSMVSESSVDCAMH